MEKNNTQPNDLAIIKYIEYKIKNGRFQNKEELNQHLIELKNTGMYQGVFTPEKTKELLELYDSLNQTEALPLDLSEYREVQLDEQKIIVSTNEDIVLKTDDSLKNDFSDAQNELMANNSDGKTKADEIFKHMSENEKIKLNFISLSEIKNYKSIIDEEILSKIYFFINNEYIEPLEYKVDIETGYFLNPETDEVLEVRKNPETGKYEIFKGGEIVYGQEQINSEENDLDIEEERDEEQQLYESRKNVKIKTLKPPTNYNNRAAFSKMSFLIVSTMLFTLLMTLILLAKK